jgi:hypothetical protein
MTKAPELPKPNYVLVAPDEWDKRKQQEGTYRYDHTAWQIF